LILKNKGSIAYDVTQCTHFYRQAGFLPESPYWGLIGREAAMAKEIDDTFFNVLPNQ
jgi:hypothetical protein